MVVWIGLLGLLFVLVSVYFIRYEGFVSGLAPLASSTTASVPAPLQDSMISRDLPGAVTPAPDQSLASTQDLIALQDALAFFRSSTEAKQSIDRETSNQKRIQGTAGVLGGLKELERELSTQEARVGAALTDLSKNNYTVEEATRLRSFYEMGTDQLLTITEGFASRPSKYKIAGPHLTANDLQELINRIIATRQSLANQRSMAPAIRARMDQLEKLAADVRQIREQLVRKQIDPRDLPIDAKSAQMFLAGLSSSTIPPLITPHGGNPLTAAIPASVQKDPMIQQLLEQAKDLRWNLQITVGYDPEVSQRERYLQRLTAIEKRLEQLSAKDSKKEHKAEYYALQRELQSLTMALGGSVSSQSHAAVRPQLPTSTRLPDLSASPPGPTRANLATAQAAEFSDPMACLSPTQDGQAGMTDEQIRHRASSGAASYGGVGGADYKTRTADLCRSIGASGLGDPKNFGCLSNPDEVGPTYSWKGAHAMVCNRLGDTWGASYPEQFGCGKYDPTARFTSRIL